MLLYTHKMAFCPILTEIGNFSKKWRDLQACGARLQIPTFPQILR